MMPTGVSMELSILISRILAIIYLAAAVGGLFNRDYYRNNADDMYKNSVLTFMMGFIATVFGYLIIHFHPVWDWRWPTLITLVGWIALFKGITLIAFPHLFRRIARPFLGDTGQKLYPWATLLIGLLFAWLGFS